MKKIICFLCLIILTLSFGACDPGSLPITPETLTDITSIELIEYTNPEQKHFNSWVPDHSDDLVPFDFSKMTVLETLPEERLTDFKDTFTQTDILYHYYAYDSPADVCIKANYSNGDFLIIWANYKRGSFTGYIGKFAQDGSISFFWGCFSSLSYYEDLVNNFFTYQI
ncbi:MAG: hypothetical protein J6S04_03715 [Clostridia bacterium]|nr:hypothetical protein [Clostridia bacterium]